MMLQLALVAQESSGRDLARLGITGCSLHVDVFLHSVPVFRNRNISWRLFNTGTFLVSPQTAFCNDARLGRNWDRRAFGCFI